MAASTQAETDERSNEKNVSNEWADDLLRRSLLAAHKKYYDILGALRWSKLLLPRPAVAPTFITITHKPATEDAQEGREKLPNTNKWTKRKLPDDACLLKASPAPLEFALQKRLSRAGGQEMQDLQLPRRNWYCASARR